jgi:hypothetical protein
LTYLQSCLTIASVARGNHMPDNTPVRNTKTTRSHVPENSALFERVIPVLLIVMGVITVVLILFAAGVLLGIVHF